MLLGALASAPGCEKEAPLLGHCHHQTKIEQIVFQICSVSPRIPLVLSVNTKLLFLVRALGKKSTLLLSVFDQAYSGVFHLRLKVPAFYQVKESSGF